MKSTQLTLCCDVLCFQYNCDDVSSIQSDICDGTNTNTASTFSGEIHSLLKANSNYVCRRKKISSFIENFMPKHALLQLWLLVLRLAGRTGVHTMCQAYQTHMHVRIIVVWFLIVISGKVSMQLQAIQQQENQFVKKDIEIQPGFEPGSSETLHDEYQSILCFPSLREIQPENETVSIDKCHHIFCSILAGSQRLFSPSFNSARKQHLSG